MFVLSDVKNEVFYRYVVAGRNHRPARSATSLSLSGTSFSVGRWGTVDVIDYKSIDGDFLRLEFEIKLILHRDEEG